jgi:hypothetical protein
MGMFHNNGYMLKDFTVVGVCYMRSQWQYQLEEGEGQSFMDGKWVTERSLYSL